MRFSPIDYFKNSPRYSTNLYVDGKVTVFCADLHAAAFIGKSGKPSFNYQFKTADQRDKYISDFVVRAADKLKQIDEYKEQKKKIKAEQTKAFKAALKAGVILSDSWGYEQTQVEFYKVLAVNGCKVKIQELGHIDVGATSWASCYVMPAVDNLIGQPLELRVSTNYIKICSSIHLTLWDGSKKYKSWYY